MALNGSNTMFDSTWTPTFMCLSLLPSSCCAPSEMQTDPFSGSKNKTVLVPLLTVTPEVGRPTNVSYYNIYAGQ